MLIIPGAEFYAQNQAVELSNWCGRRFAFGKPCACRAAASFAADAVASRRAFLSYMCYDMAHVLAVYPRLGHLDTCFHHASYAAAALVAGVSRAFPFAFGWCAPPTPREQPVRRSRQRPAGSRCAK